MSVSARPFEVRNGPHVVAGLEWPGPGPTVLLTHGAGLCAGIFEPLALALCDRYRVVALDGRGHGRSSRPESGAAYGLDEQAGDVIAALDELGVGRALGFGHSFGGAVLLEVLLTSPGRLVALAVHEPAVAFDPPERAEVRAAAFARKITERRSSWPTRAALRDEVSRWSTFREVGPEFVDALVEWGTDADPDGGVRLRCPAEVEAQLFRMTFSTGLLDRLPALVDDATPLTITFGREGTSRRPLFEHVAAAAGRPLTEVPGYHLAPFRSVELAAAVVDEHVLRHATAVGS